MGHSFSQVAGVAGAEAAEALEVVLSAAREAGCVRKDVLATDLIMLLNSAASPGPADPERDDRLIGIILDGIRPC